MSQTDHYLAQAEAAQTGADAALLDNVRDRHLRSAATWRDMAERAGTYDRLKRERDAQAEASRIANLDAQS